MALSIEIVLLGCPGDSALHPPGGLATNAPHAGLAKPATQVNPAFLPFKLLASIPYDDQMDAKETSSSGLPIRVWGTRNQVPDIRCFFILHTTVEMEASAGHQSP